MDSRPLSGGKMVVKTGAKSSAPLRRLSSLEMKGLEADKAVAPHYQWPTANSSSRARVQFKPLTPNACKYGRKSSLLGSRTSEKSPVKINRLKSLERTPLKIDALKPSRAPGFLKLKAPKSDLCSKMPTSIILAQPYGSCGAPHVKQFLASRRTKTSFKFLTEHGADTGHGVDSDSVSEREAIVCCGENTREEDAEEVWNKSDYDPRLEDCQVVDCDDYDDDGLLFESGDSHGNDGILIDEISIG
ncbi:hypothetical protein SUGI_1149190 [Cryptomeria japonica]|nr:hypothetical protein SUGI_1149190 [Cryptomeria japonica]